MDCMHDADLSEVARLFDIASDAVVVCKPDGTIVHLNRNMAALMVGTREHLVGTDIKDMLFSMSFERSGMHRLPFDLDGSESTLMLKLLDGSFVPVKVRACSIADRRDGSAGRGDAMVLVALSSLEERYAHDRQMQRVLTELQSANKRLSGTLSIIMSTVGSDDLPSLIDTVLNKLVDSLEATGSTIYFSESGGFKLRGISRGLENSYVPEFIPYGAGIPTYVLRRAQACRLTISPAEEGDYNAFGSFLDLDTRETRRLRLQDMPPFRTVVAVPVYFGTQILGLIELGWSRPLSPRVYDVRVLEVICDYLSIQLVGLASSLRSRKTAELTRSLNRMHDSFFSLDDGSGLDFQKEVIDEVCATLGCHYCPIVYDAKAASFAIDFAGGSRIALPSNPDKLFLSSRAPAARVGSAVDRLAMADRPLHTDSELTSVRVTRIDNVSSAAVWLKSHGLPSCGVYFDFGADAGSADSDGAVERDGEGIVPASELSHGMSRRFILLRDESEEPIDDTEYDYLVRLAHDFEQVMRGETRKQEERRIAQTLQVGMRSSLGEVPGITSDSLYSSATRSALVGGDFYTLIRLPDEQAVMILGDVSGKGIEAASMSALVKTALSAYAWEGAGPARMARSLNSMLMGFSRVETFATMFIAKIDLRHGRATYCSAGHPPTMLIHPGGRVADAPAAGEVELLSRQSGVVGAFETMSYETGSFTFGRGDMLFMYTDGAIEARDPDGAFFGEQRLRDLLLAHAGDDVEGLCATVLDELDRFTRSALDDDIAFVALRFDKERD